jgi:ubiquinone/menaquinone biosynthesis C-methylase UbiE
VDRRNGVNAYDVASRYDDAYFADLEARYRQRDRFARRRMANVFSLLPPLPGRKLLDLGSGMGTFAVEAAKRGASAVGIDLAPAALEAARRVADSERTLVSFVRADGAELPIRSRSVDVVLAADLTEHLDDVTLGRVLREARRVLRPAGVLVLYTPNREHIFERLRERGVLKDGDPSHIGMRSEKELADAVSAAGLRITTVRHLPSHVPAWNVLERGLGRWVPLLRRRIGLVAKEAG